MKKALLLIIGVLFLLATTAFTADKPASSVKGNTLKTNVVRAARIQATGRVVEITDESIEIERTVKGEIEKMEFALERPVTGIATNDSVKIEYAEKDGKLTAIRVVKVVLKKKEVKPAEGKPLPGKK